MKAPKGRLIICSRGHRFYKSSDCPVCPKCWSGYYRKRAGSDFPETLAAPALRALRGAGISSLAQLAERTEAQTVALHGMGPKAVAKLRAALRPKGLAFKK